MFVSAVLAGSVLAVPSEFVLAGAIGAGQVDPWLGVLVATAGNVLGALTVFACGRGAAAGSRRWAWLSRRLPELTPERAARAERWGPPLLVGSWVPFVGDALVFAGGACGLRWGPSFAWITLGKLVRYAVVAWAATAAVA
ncbi:MAG: DedA family protein [Planctomycetes bacterium]|nr:DedA family protein [Planctomycetota bacterium]